MTLWNLLILALFFLTVGFIIGALITLLFENRNQAGEKPSEKSLDVNPQFHGDSLASIFRDKGNGQLVIDMDGKRYSKKNGLTKRQLVSQIRLAQEWLDWCGVIREPAIKMDPGDLSKKSAASLPGEGSNVSASHTLSGNSIPPNMDNDSKAAVKLEADKNENNASISIVEQINLILQERLAGTEFDRRGIKLTETKKEGVVVWVGNVSYMGIDLVPDAGVRAEIKAAVEAWEKQVR